MFKELIKKIKEFIEEKNIGKDKIILIGLGVGLLIVGMLFNNDDEKVKKNEETTIQNEVFIEHYEEEYIEKIEKKLIFAIRIGPTLAEAFIVHGKKDKIIILINEKYRCFLEDYFSKYESIIDDKIPHVGCLG